MASRTPTVSYQPNGEVKLAIATWTGLLQSSTDVGVAVELPGADRSVQLTGTLGTGGVVTWQGSNLAAPSAAAASTDWGTLRDPAGNDLTSTAIGQVKQVAEMTRWIRPRVTAGDGATDLTATFLSRR